MRRISYRIGSTKEAPVIMLPSEYVSHMGAYYLNFCNRVAALPLRQEAGLSAYFDAYPKLHVDFDHAFLHVTVIQELIDLITNNQSESVVMFKIFLPEQYESNNLNQHQKGKVFTIYLGNQSEKAVFALADKIKKILLNNKMLPLHFSENATHCERCDFGIINNPFVTLAPPRIDSRMSSELIKGYRESRRLYNISEIGFEPEINVPPPDSHLLAYGPGVKRSEYFFPVDQRISQCVKAFITSKTNAEYQRVMVDFNSLRHGIERSSYSFMDKLRLITDLYAAQLFSQKNFLTQHNSNRKLSGGDIYQSALIAIQNLSLIAGYNPLGVKGLKKPFYNKILKLYLDHLFKSFESQLDPLKRSECDDADWYIETKLLMRQLIAQSQFSDFEKITLQSDYFSKIYAAYKNKHSAIINQDEQIVKLIVKDCSSGSYWKWCQENNIPISLDDVIRHANNGTSRVPVRRKASVFVFFGADRYQYKDFSGNATQKKLNDLVGGKAELTIESVRSAFTRRDPSAGSPSV